MEQGEIVNIIIDTINTILGNIISSIDNSMYSSLDNVIFIGPDIIKNSSFEKLLGANGKYGLIYLADAMLVAISMFYCVKFFYANYVETNIEKPSQFIFKLIIFTFLVNFSYFLCEQVLNINLLFSSSIQEIGKNILGIDISFSELITQLNRTVSVVESSFNLFSISGIIKSFVSVGLMNLLFSYSLRYIILQVFLLFTPFALLSLIVSSTSWIFRSWFKCMFSLLIIQCFIPIVLIVIFSIDFSNKILFIGGIYALTKINSYVRELFGGVGIDVSNQFGNVLSFFKK